MSNRAWRSMTVCTLLALGSLVCGLPSSGQPPGAAKSPAAPQTRPKNLRETALDRDVVIDGGIYPGSEYSIFEELTKSTASIVDGRLIEAKSFFDESGHPIEYGENITTEYTVEVLRVLKDTTMNNAPTPGRALPAPLSTPLKIARHGGVVEVNGHRAEVKYEGYDSLKPGKHYVFFLHWSPDYQAYTLAGNISGVIMVEDDLRLKPLGSSKEIQAKLHGLDLESLIDEVTRHN